jgi:NADH:ubiquinone oxidoreductase subunit 6 (subunit J)
MGILQILEDMIKDTPNLILFIMIVVFSIAILDSLSNSLPKSEPVVNQTIEKGKESISILFNGYFIIDAISGIALLIAIIYWYRNRDSSP